MIVKMCKTYVVARGAHRDRLLETLRGLGALHLTPVDPASAVAGDETLSQIDRLGRAIQILSNIEPAGEAVTGASPLESADEALEIVRTSIQKRSRLAILHRQIEQLAVWGDVRLEDFTQLSEAGLNVEFFSVARSNVDSFDAEFTHEVTLRPGKRVLVAVVNRNGEAELPQLAEIIERPRQDRPSIRAEAGDIDAQLKQGARKLRELAGAADAMIAARQELSVKAQFAAAQRGGIDDEQLFAVQGWTPANRAETLSDDLAAAGIDSAVESYAPAEDETPPTLIRYPAWARPIKAMFDTLGTLPGYREIDLAPFFMIALPIFTAILIGDAGYGALFLLAGIVFYRKASARGAAAKVQLVMVMGVATIVWGLISGNIFGLSPTNLQNAGGVWASIGAGLDKVQIIRGSMSQQTDLVMKISFIMGAIHLSLAQLRQALAFTPNLRALARIGWALFLWGIFQVVWYLFFGSQVDPVQLPHWSMAWLLAIGAGMAILFEKPDRNPAKMVGVGLASFPFTALGAFSDSISYIRLMGVGLASTIIGQTFNNLGAQMASGATWFAGAPIVLVGHALNVALCLIAILAHGVRLNMLEFSNNAGVQWSGYEYRPFAATEIKER